MHGEQDVRIRVGGGQRRRGRMIAAAVVALAGSGVGLATAAAAAGGAGSLGRFVLRAGEQTGFVPTGHLKVERSLDRVIALEAREGVAGFRTDRVRLRHEGFRAFVVQRMRSLTDPGGSDGLSTVLELGSHRAARAELRFNVRRAKAYQTRGAAISTLRLPGIPGLLGFTAIGPGAGGATNAYAAWGRCLVFVGDGVSAGDPEAPVRAAFAALYARTGTNCP